MTESREPDKRRSHPPEEPAGGSGTAGPQTPEQEQAGSYARDAEQDPAGERHGRADSEGPSEPI